MSYFAFRKNKDNREIRRGSDERLPKPAPPPSRQSSSATATAAPSPTSIKTSNSTGSSQKQQPSPRLALRNEDPLPTSFAALEGHLNHHASQLQQLADRVESINEWIELDNIVLSRLIRDEEKRIDEVIASERTAAKANAPPTDKPNIVHFALGPTLPTSPSSSVPQPLSNDRITKRSASVGDVPRSAPLPPLPLTSQERKAEALAAHSGISEARERVRAMKRWRKQLEHAVVWQREEFWRVEAAMGKQAKKGGRSESVLMMEGVVGGGAGGKVEGKGEGQGEGGNGEGGEGLQVVRGEAWEDERRGKWSRESAGGRLPTQREWEAFFSYA